MTTVRELVTEFGFKADQRGADDVQGVIKGLKNGLVGVVAAAGAAMTGIYALATEVAKFGDDAIKTAQRLGMSVETFQELDFALKLSGTSMHEQRASFVRFARVVRDANNGLGRQVKVMNDLGIQVRETNGQLKPMRRLVLEASDALRRLPDGVEKTSLSLELFGRRGSEMIQFLNLGSEAINEFSQEAQNLGGVLSTEAAQNSEILNDTLFRLKLALHGVKLQVGGELIPVVTDAVQRVLDLVMANQDLMKTRLRQSFMLSIRVLRAFIEVVGFVTEKTEQAIDVVGGLERAVFKLSFAIGIFVVGAGFKAVMAIGFFSTAITAASIKLTLLNTKLAITNFLLGALPFILVTVAALTAVMIDDLRRYLQGHDSLIGRLIESYGNLDDGIEGTGEKAARFFSDLKEHGSDALAMWSQDIGFFFQRVDLLMERSKLAFKLTVAEFAEMGRDILDIIAMIPGVENRTRRGQGEEQSEAQMAEMRDRLNRMNYRDTQNLLNQQQQERMIFREELAFRRHGEITNPPMVGERKPQVAHQRLSQLIHVEGMTADEVTALIQMEQATFANRTAREQMMTMLPLGEELSFSRYAEEPKLPMDPNVPAHQYEHFLNFMKMPEQ